MYSQLRAKKSYEDEPDAYDFLGQPIRINRNRANEKKIGRFTIIDDIEPHKSYEDYPDFIDERGNEVRINRKRPNERQVGRFTIVDEPEIKSSSRRKTKRKSRSPKKIVGKLSRDINLYPGQKVGRFKIKDIVISNRPRTSSPKNLKAKLTKSVILYPGKKIGRFTVVSVPVPGSPKKSSSRRKSYLK